MADQKSLLNKLLISDGIERLNAVLNEFNPFEVLGVSSYEIRHSNMLGWLLDPNSQHNLGDIILKKFILKTLENNEDKIEQIKNSKVDEEEGDSSFDLVTFQLMDLSDVIVEREKNNIDVLVVSPKNNLVLVIENKIKAKESSHQLKKYKNNIIANYPKYTKIFIYLTINGEEAQNDQEFLNISHSLVVDIVKHSLELYSDRMNSKVSDFITFYIKTLQKEINMDNDIRDLALKIYNENKEAIDIINTVLKSEVYNISIVGALFQKEFSKEIKEWKKSTASYWFAPLDIVNQDVCEALQLYWPSDFPISLFFYRQGGNGLRLYIEVGPIDYPKLRERLIVFLDQLKNDKGESLFKISQNAKVPGARYSKIYSSYEPINNWKNDKVLEVMIKMYKEVIPDLNILSKELKSFDWNLDKLE